MLVCVLCCVAGVQGRVEFIESPPGLVRSSHTSNTNHFHIPPPPPPLPRRSLGDIAAETVGVYAEPELSEVVLGRNDRFIIWATDGVWEFISSQEAVDIVAPYLDKSPVEACGALVREATKRWGEEEDVVDDTTCIIAFLEYT